jgi:hypothetical protein
VGLSGDFVESAATGRARSTFFPIAGIKVERGARNDADSTLFSPGPRLM